MRKYLMTVIGFILLVAVACNKDKSEPNPNNKEGDLLEIPYNPTPYFIKRLEEFPELEIPDDNPLTEEGIALGRHLFYDPILSADSTLSCAGCHLPNAAFTDNKAVSLGVNQTAGHRSSMAIMNVGYYNTGLFWDGRVKTLEDQALLPVEDPLKMHESWPNVIEKIKTHPVYPEKFRKAFGIEDREEITKFLAAKAIAQFERTLIVGENSRFYKVFVNQEDFPSDAELNGYLMYFDASNGSLPDAQCYHCHNRPLFTDNEYRNNGITPVASLDEFPDLGRGFVNGRRFDNGKFRTPTLWNIELTAPYMHNGQFETLEEVMDHYTSGGHYAENLDPYITDIHLDEEQKSHIIAFLKMLTDTTFTQNPAFQNPFE